MALSLLQPITPFSSRPGAGDYGYSFNISVPKPPQPTPQQVLKSIQARERPKEGSSFWDKVKSGGGGALSRALNVILRPSWAMAEGTRRAMEGEGFDISDFFKGASRGIQAKRQTTFSEVLNQEGILQDHGKLRAVAGFSLDVVTDPINMLLIGAAPFTGGATAGIAGARVAATGLMKAGRVGQTSRTADLLAIRDAVHKVRFNRIQLADPELGAVRAYADVLDEAITIQLNGMRLPEHLVDELAGVSRQAADQVARNIPRVIQPKIRVPFSRGKYVPLAPTKIGGMRVAPKAPSLFRTAEGAGVLGHVPGMAAAARGVGKTFKTSFSDDLAGAKLTSRHVEEMRTKQYTDEVQAEMRGAVHAKGKTDLRKLEVKRQEEAIDWYDETKGVVMGTGEGRSVRVLNESALTKSGLDLEQRTFVRVWHELMERARLRDKDRGLIYEFPIDGRGYVPHFYKSDPVNVATKGKLSTPRHIRERKDPNMTLRQLREMKEEMAKQGHDVSRFATDPIELITLHMRQAGRAHAEATFRRSAGRAFGIPHKIPDTKKVDAINNRLKTLHERSLALSAQVSEEGIRAAKSREKSPLGKKYAEQEREATRRAQVEKTEADEKLLDLETEFQAFQEVRDANRAVPTAFGDMVKMSDKELNALVRSGEITKAAGKVMRQLRRKFRAGDTDAAELRKFWNDFMDTMFVGHKRPWAAVRKNIEKGRERIDDRLATKLAKIADDKEEDFAKADARVSKRTEKAETELDKLTKRIVNNEGRLERAMTAKLNPAVTDRGWVPVESPTMKMEFGTDYAFHPRVAAALERLDKFLVDDDAIKQFDNMWAKMTAVWKTFVTVVNPGYRMRNTASDWWNMLLDGVPFWAIPVYAARATKLMAQAKRGNPKAVERMQEAYADGILSGLFTGDIQTAAEMARFGGPYKFLFSKKKKTAALRVPIRAAHDFNRNAENWGRLTHYLYRTDFEKVGRTRAAEHVRAAHFDYEDLTKFEQQKLKMIAPFYTWTRKNIPFQIQQLIQRPGRMAIVPKFVQESEIAAGGGEGDLLSEFQRGGFAFKVPVGGDKSYLLPQIGFADLEKVSSLKGAAEFAHLLHPIPKAAGELITGRSFFTGAPIEGTHPRTPVADPGGLVTNLIAHIPNLPIIGDPNVGQTSRRIRGQDVGGLGINPWYAYIFGQLPITNQFFLRKSDIKKAQGGLGGKAAMVSYLGGISMAELDEETGDMIAQLQFEEEFRKYLRGLRDEGVFPQVEEDGFSDFEQSVRDIISEGARR